MEKQLLEWALKNSTETDDKPATATETRTTSNLDPGVIEAILGTPDSVKIKQCLKAISDESDTIENRTIAFDNLELLVENMDNANDLEPMKLWPVIISLLRDKHEVMRKYCAWVIGTCLQNNPKSQSDFLKHNGLHHLLQCLGAETNVEAKVKCLYAISGAIKHHEDALKSFLDLDGVSLLERQLKEEQEPSVIRRYLYLLHGISLMTEPSVFAPKFQTLIPGLCNILKTSGDVDACEKCLELFLAFHPSHISQKDFQAIQQAIHLLSSSEYYDPSLLRSIKTTFCYPLVQSFPQYCCL